MCSKNRKNNFAEWLRRQGFKVKYEGNCYWYNPAFMVYQAFPYGELLAYQDSDLKLLFKKLRAVGLRYSTALSSRKGVISYHVVKENGEYDLNSVNKNARKNIRKGLKNCTVKQIPLERYAREGWELEKETLARQERLNKKSKKNWKVKIDAASDIEGFDAWGALVDGKLAAALLLFSYEDHVEMISQQSLSKYFKLRVNNALTYVVTENISKMKNTKFIFHALQSLDASQDVDVYKFRMGYSAKPVKQVMDLHPLLGSFINETTMKALNLVTRPFRQKSFSSKATGFLKFYIEGRKSI